MESVKGKVIGKEVPKKGFRWSYGELRVRGEDGQEYRIKLLGTLVQWFNEGDIVRVEVEKLSNVIEPNTNFKLYKVFEGSKVPEEVGEVLVWPLFRKEYTYPRLDPVSGDVLYTYKIVAREASTEEDYMAIVELEQYHYASKKELVALWKCPDGEIIESNIQPTCKDGSKAELVAIKGSLPASRFLVLELAERQPFEPRIVGYVRIDPPIPLMHRRIVREDGTVLIEKNIRLKVFPKEWFYPTFWPEYLMKKLLRRYRKLAAKYGRRKALYMLSEKVKEEALRRCNTCAARIARVVVHPDYRGDGLGKLAVQAAIEWVRERRIPEMRKRKHVIETIAQMARYNPFFERVGFKFLWETASGRPALYYPLTDEARKRIEKFLKEDPYASKHGGVLYRPRFGGIEPLKGPIIFRNVTKVYESVLDLSKLPEKLQNVLKAFGVERRVVQKYVLRDVNLEIKPGEIVAVVGVSGAGKTTFLRLIYGAAKKIDDKRYKPTQGEITVPDNVKVAALLPGEVEPTFGDESLLEHMYRKLGDEVAAIEVLNVSGLSDAVFYRAKFSELSTGQKERAKIASLLAERPNLLLIDEFTAHLDFLTSQKVARKVAAIARQHKITLIVATNKQEVISVLRPDKMVYVGYGNIIVKQCKW